MNTLVQDLDIPIYIMLQYGINVLKFPINPEALKMDIDSTATTEFIEGIGEVSVPSSPKLATISINSFFWQDMNLMPNMLYVNWLKKWQKSKTPAKLIVTRFNYSMQVTCEKFTYEMRAGEESDVYFELDLKQYRPYSAKILNMPSASSVLSVLETIDSATLPILVEIPRPTRSQIKKVAIKNTWIAKTLTSISEASKIITGSTSHWKDIYDENKELLGDLLNEDKEIEAGTELKVPSKYVTDSSDNSTQGIDEVSS